ncbi:MAG: glycosyltransferase family 1 protein [Pseudomonadales bacterium]|nr:glycosyltransferase family 1 protein [Pseudomonadales bacterium]
MRILLSTIGSRGDVQPLVALALALREMNQAVHFCVPPDFRQWIEDLGFTVTTIGPELRQTGKAGPPSAPPDPEQLRLVLQESVNNQFETLLEAAAGCDAILGATALQIAAPSVARYLGISYTFVAYSPCVLPSRDHAPPVLTRLGEVPNDNPDDFQSLWDQDAARWNGMWLEALNSNRNRLKLPPLADVRSHVLTEAPWLAADPALAPWTGDSRVWQTGPWLIDDAQPLNAEVEEFLAAGEAPVYFGFGSIRVTPGLNEAMIQSARNVGRRVIVSRGWAELSVPQGQADCLAIGEVNQQLLFRRVAAVVHHGGAGTTTAAARASAPQVIIPQLYDQPYWSQRIQALGIGVAHPFGTADEQSLTGALSASLKSAIAERTAQFAAVMQADGAEVAARKLVDQIP